MTERRWLLSLSALDIIDHHFFKSEDNEILQLQENTT